MIKINEVFFDLETKNLFKDVNSNNPADLGVSIVSTYSREVNDQGKEINGQMSSYWENDFDKLWPVFKNAKRIIAFNSLGFDIPALQPYASFELAALPHFDILQKVKDSVGKRLSLEHLARTTLGSGKSDLGVKAVSYWRKQDKKSLTKLQKYCEDDVMLTRDMYDYVIKNGFLSFTDKWNHPQKIILDFSYPALDQSKEEQITMF